MQLTSESIKSAISGDQGDKSKCSSCNKYHLGKCNKPKNTAALNQGGDKPFLVCNKSFHKYTTNTQISWISVEVTTQTLVQITIYLIPEPDLLVAFYVQSTSQNMFGNIRGEIMKDLHLDWLNLIRPHTIMREKMLVKPM